MTWNPDPTVTIGGVDFTGETLNGVQIQMGRTSIWEQPRAGYCQVDLINLNENHWNLSVNDQVVVTVDNATGTPVTLFSGKLVTIANRVNTAGAVADTVTQTITAIGSMSEMSRTFTGGSSWPKEYDTARLTRILTAAGVTIDTVDSPGVYEFTTITPDINDTYSLAGYYAQMGFGYIYETPSGKIGYANESRRTVDVATNGYLNIPTSVILGRSVSSEMSFKDLLNDITLIWKNGGIKTSSSASSIADYGRAAAKIETELEDSAQAQFQADRYIAIRSRPQTNLNSFTVQLDAPAMTNSLLNSLLGVNIGKPIRITGLPTGILDTTFDGFVEQHTFTINRNQVQLSILATDATYSITPTRWQDVSASLIWSNVPAGLQWFNYE